MSAVGSHLVRRGVEAVTYMDEKKVKIDLPSWAIVMFGLTVVAFVVIDVMVRCPNHPSISRNSPSLYTGQSL